MSDANPSISVIIPARNAGSTIAMQLTALAEQLDAPPFEVIVADNGSSDGTVTVARSFVDVLDVHVVDASDVRGPSYARNVGATAARGEHLLFCDADDRVGPRWVAAMHEVLLTQTVGTGPVMYVDELQHTDSATSTPHGPRRYLEQVPFAPSNNLGMRASLFRALEGFDLELLCCQDADLTIRAHQAGDALAWAPEAIVHNARRPTLRAAAKQFFRYGYYDALVYRKLRGRGLRQRRPWQMLRPYVILAATPYRLLTRRRWSWVINAAQRAGRLVGSVKWRVLCP
jgi:glycosyltransferase involved in cell wall biosynthesis